MPSTLDKKTKAEQMDRTHFSRGPGGPHLGSQTPLGSWGARSLGVTSLSEAQQRGSRQTMVGGGRHFIRKALAEPLPRGAHPGAPGGGGWEQPCRGPINTSPQATGVAPRIPRHMGCWEAIKTSSTAEGAGKDWWGTAKPPEEQRPALLPRLLSTRGPGAQPAEGASSQRHQALTREASRVEVLLAPASEKAALPRHSGPAGGVLQTEPSCPWPGRARRADGSPPQGGRGKGGVSEAPVRPQPPDGASCRSEHGPVQEGRGA